MKEKILALLLAKFAGVRKDGLARLAQTLSLQVADETEAGALVEKLTIERVNEFVTDYRKDVDKEVSDATKTHEVNLRKKFDFVEKGDPNNPASKTEPKKTEPGNIAEVVKAAVAEAVKPFQEKILQIEGGNTKKSRLQLLEGKLKDVPETYKAQKIKDFERMNFDTDEAFNEYLTETESGIAAFNQELANKGLSGQGKPVFGKKEPDGVSAEVKQFIAGKKEGQEGKPLTGKTV